jgi:hypothetical protein
MNSAQARLQSSSAMSFELESILSTSLRPVDPNPQFVDRLSDRFKQPPATMLEQKSFLGAYLIMASGLFLGALVLWLFQRIGSARRYSPAAS